MRIGPVAFLFVVAAGWAAMRAAMLWPDVSLPAAPKRITWQPPLNTPSAAPEAELPQATAVAMPLRAAPSALPAQTLPPPLVQRSLSFALAQTPQPAADSAAPRQAVAPIYPPQPYPPAKRDRLSLSAWAIVRGEAGPGLASAGQLGGSQAGIRGRYDLGSGLAAAVRISGPLRSRHGKEAALAFDWRPFRRVPLTFTIERRAGLDRGGRDAFAAGMFGGFDTSLPYGIRADGYAQAGVVGLKRRDVYIDGALRAERTLVGSGRFRLAAGAGAWGGAQPGVSRLDVGPHIVAHLPVGGGGLRVAAEWRERVAGEARPGSGPSLSIGADF
jgi:hypothetical protein